MKKKVVEQAMKLYQKKFGGNLAKISIMFVNVIETLVEAEQAAQQERAADVCPDCAGKGIVKDGFGVLFECSRCRGSGQRG